MNITRLPKSLRRIILAAGVSFITTKLAKMLDLGKDKNKFRR